MPLLLVAISGLYKDYKALLVRLGAGIRQVRLTHVGATALLFDRIPAQTKRTRNYPPARWFFASAHVHLSISACESRLMTVVRVGRFRIQRDWFPLT